MNGLKVETNTKTMMIAVFGVIATMIIAGIIGVVSVIKQCNKSVDVIKTSDKSPVEIIGESVNKVKTDFNKGLTNK